MKYNFIKTDNIIETLFEYNNITKKELDYSDSFMIEDKAILNFKEELQQAKNLKFLIVGDFDCDGICATTIIKKLLDKLNIKNNYYIPSRIKEGYGINDEIINKAISYNFDALLLVDNGVAFKEQIDKAINNNIKVFIIDHHEFCDLPKATIIHNTTVDKKYENLSAAGLSYLLSKTFYDDELSLVLGGLATLSDMMPVIGFNRALINRMYEIIDNVDQLKLLNDNKKISYDDIVFNIIPKINAISRMEPLSNPNYLVRYFLDNDYMNEYINTINYINEQRKLCTKQMYTIASNMINEEDKIILLYSDKFKEGLCGLLANRLLNEYNKPVIILAMNDSDYKGSARGPKDINMYNLFKDFMYYSSFGGHAGALGLSFNKERINDFKDFVKNINITDFENTKDVFLVEESQLTNELIGEINDLKPFGERFELPLFGIENKGYKKIIIKDMYSKYLISNNFSAICFSERLKDFNPKYLIGSIKKDTYKKDSISLLIEDLV